MKLSILIPTTPDREPFMQKLFDQCVCQIGDDIDVKFSTTNKSVRHIFKNKEVEILVYTDDYENSVGSKRNYLLNESEGEYITFIDSDDRIGPNYFKHAFEGIKLGVDACGLTGIITEDGLNPKKFVHSIKYDHWFENDNVYYRNNNHLNVVKRSIAIQMKFPEVNQGEDHSYSKQLQASGLIKTEYWDENEIIYYYDYVSKK